MKDAEREKELGVLYECFAQTTGDFSGTVMRTRCAVCCVRLYRRPRENAAYKFNSFKAFLEMFSGSCAYIINIAAFICGVILILLLCLEASKMKN